MAPFLLLLLTTLPLSSSGPVTQSLSPNKTFTPFNFVDSSGEFLSSPNSTFSAFFYNPGSQQSNYYLFLIHSPSNSLVWAANPNAPLPSTATLSLSPSALSLSFPNGSLAWSTPRLSSPIHSLRLLDSGNLVLLNSSNSSLWQSFEHPTDTLLPGQRLALGSWLASPVSDLDLSDGGYRLVVTADDAVMRWRGSQQYWSLSTDLKSIKDYDTPAAYMEINGSGLYLFDAGHRIVYQVVLPVTDGFRMGKLDSRGQFRIVSYQSGNASDDFIAPSFECDLPFACKTLELCSIGSNEPFCKCSDPFRPANGGDCSPTDGSVLASSSTCGGSSSVSYLSLGSRISYFANKFTTPLDGSDFSSCQDMCSKNCSCLGFFYKNSSMSCYLIQNQLGSLIRTDNSITLIGYIKTLKSSSSLPNPTSLPNSTNKSFANMIKIFVTLPLTLILLVLSYRGFQWWRMTNNKGKILKLRVKKINPVQPDSLLEDEVTDNYGLPTRFTYADLALATNNFQTLIGSGGFGSVYKGELPDKSLIAVKKIINIGIQGKREFCAEIAAIGKIHHVNLVRLRGYCSQGSNRLLVYEYMNRGSLDRPLFGAGQTIDWQERLEIAIGAARGLAYLHSACDPKILHFDIKPENILLADHGQVKIADFGMAKLMNRGQSRIFTRMRGTRGYIAPEWLTNSAISDKADVYSYGMVLLEIVGGRRNSSTGLVDSSRSSGEYFPLMAFEKHVEGRWVELVDPRIEGRVAESEVMRVVKVALCCLNQESCIRPSMSAVVGMLEGTLAVSEPRVEGLKYLRMYGRERGEEIGGNSTSSETSTTSRASLMTNVSAQDLSGPR